MRLEFNARSSLLLTRKTFWKCECLQEDLSCLLYTDMKCKKHSIKLIWTSKVKSPNCKTTQGDIQSSLYIIKARNKMIKQLCGGRTEMSVTSHFSVNLQIVCVCQKIKIFKNFFKVFNSKKNTISEVRDGNI